MKCYIVDAFAEKLFEGNPAAVCILDAAIPDGLMQSIAIENNLSETAFAVKTGDSYHLRWFTPGGEIDLCGHATLATAFVLSRFFRPEADEFRFDTLSGRLTVTKSGGRFVLDFPARVLRPYPITERMVQALGGARPREAYISRDLLFVFDSESDIVALQPDFAKIKALDEGLAAFVTAPGDSFDFVARAFVPKLCIDEDPVTGMMFCSLIPYWSARTGRQQFTARQVSHRGGTVYCALSGERVKIGGTAVLYAVSELEL